jgi:hypothetical protein
MDSVGDKTLTLDSTWSSRHGVGAEDPDVLDRAGIEPPANLILDGQLARETSVHGREAIEIDQDPSDSTPFESGDAVGSWSVGWSTTDRLMRWAELL